MSECMYVNLHAIFFLHLDKDNWPWRVIDVVQLFDKFVFDPGKCVLYNEYHAVIDWP